MEQEKYAEKVYKTPILRAFFSVKSNITNKSLAALCNLIVDF